MPSRFAPTRLAKALEKLDMLDLLKKNNCIPVTTRSTMVLDRYDLKIEAGTYFFITSIRYDGTPDEHYDCLVDAPYYSVNFAFLDDKTIIEQQKHYKFCCYITDDYDIICQETNEKLSEYIKKIEPTSQDAQKMKELYRKNCEYSFCEKRYENKNGDMIFYSGIVVFPTIFLMILVTAIWYAITSQLPMLFLIVSGMIAIASIIPFVLSHLTLPYKYTADGRKRCSEIKALYAEITKDRQNNYTKFTPKLAHNRMFL